MKRLSHLKHVNCIILKIFRLRTKEVTSLKVLGRNQFVEEATWEAEEDMKKRYPYLFHFGKIPEQGNDFCKTLFKLICYVVLNCMLGI